MSVADLREHYCLAGLSEEDTPPDPLQFFRSWFEQALAAGLREVNAMTLATATPDGRPSARTVLLKGLDERGFAFFTNYESRKGHELAVNPRAALLFFWSELERQVRIEGHVEPLSRQESESYFATRPAGSKYGAWASAQSRVIPGRETLERELAGYKMKYPDEQVPCPPFWGGYLVVPVTLEFWQGRADRLHDRICYSRENGGWKKERLAP